jgi:hypothetical protein
MLKARMVVRKHNWAIGEDNTSKVNRLSSMFLLGNVDAYDKGGSRNTFYTLILSFN